MEIETIFFLSVVIISAGIGLTVAVRVYRAHQRQKKAFNYNPWE